MAFKNPFAGRMATQLQLQMQPNPQRSIFIQQLMARALQNNGRPSRSIAESADIASAPIVAALLSRQDQKSALAKQAQQQQLANQLVGGAMRTNIPVENLDGAPPDNYSVPSQSPVDPQRQALAGILAQSPEAMGQMALSQLMPPAPKQLAPMNVGAGGAVYDPNTKQPLFTNPTVRDPIEQQRLDQQNRLTEQSQAETARHNRATELAANPLAMDQPGQIPGPQLTGQDFLKTLPGNIAPQVQALAEGRMQFPSGFALKSPYWQQMLTAVSQYDPSFDAVNYNARPKTRGDFTSGKSAQNIKSLNTAIGHLGTLASQIGGTASHGLKSLNWLQNQAAEATGNPGPTMFKQTAGALASELTQVFRGTGGAEADVKRYLSELDVNGSQAQKEAAVKNIVDLLNSRVKAIGDQYDQGMGTTSDPLNLLNPTAKAVIQALGGGVEEPARSSMGPTPAQPGTVHWNDLK